MQQYLSIIKRWFWILIIASLITGTTAYTVAKAQPPVYETSALLIVGPGIDSLSPDLNDLRAAAQLMQSYAEIATTKPILEGIIHELNLSMSPGALARDINIRADETTQILTIRVEGGDAVQVANIANVVATTLVRMSPSGINGSESQLKNQVRTQIDKLEQESARIETMIVELDKDLQAAGHITEKHLIADQISQERNNLADARRTLASLYQSLQGSYTNQVKIIEAASIGEPLDSGLSLTVLMGTIAGLIMGLAIALAFEYFKGTIDTVEELGHVTSVPNLCVLPKYKALNGSGPKRLVVLANPGSRAAETYRTLGSKLLFSKRETPPESSYAIVKHDDGNELLTSNMFKPLRSVLISGTFVDDDTSEVAANLAVVLAQMRYKVILVDAHLHRPNIGKIFGVSTQDGVAGTLNLRATKPIGTQIMRSIKPELVPIEWAHNLSVLPSGPVSSDPFELLVSAHMTELIKELENQADIVLISAPPLLSFAESLFLASHMEGVILSVRSGRTRRSTLTSIVESLRSLHIPITGTILDHNSLRKTALPTRRESSPAETQYTIKLAKGRQTPLRSIKM